MILWDQTCNVYLKNDYDDDNNAILAKWYFHCPGR